MAMIYSVLRLWIGKLFCTVWLLDEDLNEDIETYTVPNSTNYCIQQSGPLFKNFETKILQLLFQIQTFYFIIFSGCFVSGGEEKIFRAFTVPRSFVENFRSVGGQKMSEVWANKCF